MMLSKGNKMIIYYVLAAVVIYFLFFYSSGYRKTPPRTRMPMVHTPKKSMYVPNSANFGTSGPPMYDKFGVPIPAMPTSKYKMSGTNQLDGISVTAPVSSTGMGTRKNMLYDIRPQPTIGTEVDPLASYTPNSNPVLNNNLF
jgi:hypothetical protein